MIKDFQPGTTITATLLVKSSEIKMTKNGKPYLFVVFTDGHDEITGNKWDYAAAVSPPANEILDVSAAVTTWNGSKQLTITRLVVNTEMNVSDFAPQGPNDPSELWLHAMRLADHIQEPNLKELVLSTYEQHHEQLLIAPAAKGVHHAYIGGLLEHSVSMAELSIPMAKHTGADVGLCVAGCLLHDIGKLGAYQLNGAVIEMTDAGKLLDHMMIGCTMLDPENPGTPFIQHIILSHHGQPEWGSAVKPKMLEAWIVHYCDMLDSRAAMIHGAEMEDTIWTKKTYYLDSHVRLPAADANE